ncbi:caspase recruitment domain-containing protein 8-like [Festucalex cinctus]
MSTITSTPKSEEDKNLKSERRQLRVTQMKFHSVPEVTLGILDYRAKMGSDQIKTRKSSFSSWLSKVIKDLVVCVVNFGIEANKQPDDVVLTELDHTHANLLIDDLLHQFSSPLPGISATTSEFLTGPPPPPETITHVELHQTERQKPATYTVPAYPHIRYSDRSARPGNRPQARLPRSRSCTWLGQTGRSRSVTSSSASLPDLFLKDFEHFTPDITLGGPKETYHLQCFRAGRYQCTVTGLVFDVDGEGDVRYSVVSWDMDLLQNHCKKPAGPLFDIQCERLTVRQLHLPHCEILPAAEAGHPLSVGHVSAEGLELITPEETTRTHVIVNVSGCSGFGLMANEDAPLVPIRALVEISVIREVPSIQAYMLPENVVQDQMRRQRVRSNCNERFITTIPDCMLVPQREYTLASMTELETVLIQPDRAPFYRMSHNYNPSFQILRYGNLDEIHLTLREFNSNNLVWSAVVSLLEAAQGKCESFVEALRNVWSEFIRRLSMAVVQRLVDRLFQDRVLGEPDRTALDSETRRNDKARLLLDTVLSKGEAACEMMVTFLREEDPYNANGLGLV